MYAENGDQVTLDRKAQRVVAKSVIDGLGGLRFVREAITNAPRSRTDAAGRQWNIGPNVAEMVTGLLSWEGLGELRDFWLHKVRQDWYDLDARLTEHKLRTARKTGIAEGLWEEREGKRPSDGVQTTWYRLDIVRLGLVAVESELNGKKRLIRRERRRQKLNAYGRRVSVLERAKGELLLLSDGTEHLRPEPSDCTRGDEGAVLETRSDVGPRSHIDNLSPLQRTTPSPREAAPQAQPPDIHFLKDVYEEELAKPAPGGPPEARDAALDRSAVSGGPAGGGISDVGMTDCQGADDDLDELAEFLDEVLPVGSGRVALLDDKDPRFLKPLLKGSTEGRRRENVRLLDELIAQLASKSAMPLGYEEELEGVVRRRPRMRVEYAD